MLNSFVLKLINRSVFNALGSINVLKWIMTNNVEPTISNGLYCFICLHFCICFFNDLNYKNVNLIEFKLIELLNDWFQTLNRCIFVKTKEQVS